MTPAQPGTLSRVTVRFRCDQRHRMRAARGRRGVAAVARGDGAGAVRSRRLLPARTARRAFPYVRARLPAVRAGGRRAAGRVDTALGRPAVLDFVDMAAGSASWPRGCWPRSRPSWPRGYGATRSRRPRARPGSTPASPGPAAASRRPRPALRQRVARQRAAPGGRAGPRGPPALRRGPPRRRRGTARRRGRRAGRAWLERWWPWAETVRPPPRVHGLRAEIGLPREAAWARPRLSLTEGLAVAVDYGHTAGRPAPVRHPHRLPRRPPGPPGPRRPLRPDRPCRHRRPPGHPDHPARGPHPLGLSAPRPPLSLATHDPTAYLRALAAARQAAELTAPGALGDFLWLATPVGPRCGTCSPPDRRPPDRPLPRVPPSAGRRRRC